jgi:hypothetical protein
VIVTKKTPALRDFVLAGEYYGDKPLEPQDSFIQKVLFKALDSKTRGVKA